MHYHFYLQILSTIGLFLTYRTDSTDYLTISGFTSLNGLICLDSVLDKAWLSVGFQTHLKSSHFHSYHQVLGVIE